MNSNAPRSPSTTTGSANSSVDSKTEVHGASHVKLHSREAILMSKHFNTSGKGPLKFKGLPYLLESSSIDPFLFFACSFRTSHPSFLSLVCFSLKRWIKLHLHPADGTDSSSLYVTHRNEFGKSAQIMDFQ